MRLGVIAVASLAIAGCRSAWQLDQAIDTSCVAYDFWLDQDGDRWGDPGTDPKSSCEGDETTGYTARNGRDCDDGDASVTGRVGSLCPADLVIGGADYTGVLYGADSEFVVVDEATADLVWPGYAEDACSPWGWGGSLAVFDDHNLADLAAIQDALDGVDVWAGWIGVVPDGSGGWTWESDSDLDLDTIGSCSADWPDSSELGDDARLALVKRAGEWCIGWPEDAVTGDDPNGTPDFGTGLADFVCERSAPSPDDYAETASATP